MGSALVHNKRSLGAYLSPTVVWALVLALTALALLRFWQSRYPPVEDREFYWRSAVESSGVPGWSTPWEYPPLTGLLVTPMKWANDLQQASVYWSNIVIALAAVVMLLALWRVRSSNRLWALVYLLVTIGLTDTLFTARIDAISCAIVLLGLLALRSGRSAAAGAIFAIAGFVKVWPYILASTMGVATRRWALLVGMMSVVGGVTFAGLIFDAHPWSWLTFSSGRPLHAESFAALPGMWAQHFGLKGQYYVTQEWFGAVLHGPYLRDVLLPALILSAGILVSYATWRMWKLNRLCLQSAWSEATAAYSVIVVSAVLISNVVFSETFVLWLMPIIVVALLDRWLIREAFLVLSIIALTSFWYPVLYQDLVSNPPALLPLTLMTIRDALIVILVVSALSRLRPPKQSDKSLRTEPRDSQRVSP